MTAPPRARRDCRCTRARHQHGTRGAYERDRCRCFLCRVAHANATRTYRHGGTWREAPYIDGTGTRRRLRALTAAGVVAAQIAEHAGMSTAMVYALRNSASTTVTRRHAARIAAAYEALWDKGSGDPRSRAAATVARARGYAPPLAWDDDTIDDPAAQPNLGPHAHRYGPGRPTETVPDVVDDIAIAEAIHGRAVRLTAAEAVVVVKQLTDRGWSAARIAQRIGTTTRTVTRKRAAA